MIEKSKIGNNRIKSNKLKRNISKRNNDEFKDTIVLCVIFLFFVIVFSFIFSSKTFLKRAYENKYIIVNVPFLTFFVNDSNNVLEIKSLKNEDYLRSFYEKNIFKSQKFNECDCNGEKFFYNPDTSTIIYSVDIISGKHQNVIKIKYSDKTFEELCFGN